VPLDVNQAQIQGGVVQGGTTVHLQFAISFVLMGLLTLLSTMNVMITTLFKEMDAMNAQ